MVIGQFEPVMRAAVNLDDIAFTEAVSADMCSQILQLHDNGQWGLVLRVLDAPACDGISPSDRA
ncbi:MAG: hypothetical protein ABN482_03415 [Corticimicrobacter sp.]|uniref:hypothetical protein n=1 Tax=Corticimicrobacter sp. TaxID=2678536 RepID=UPI0011800CF0|nr:hypothetical protein FMZ60_01720 [Alcaligenaceae bacterium SJ-26]